MEKEKGLPKAEILRREAAFTQIIVTCVQHYLSPYIPCLFVYRVLVKVYYYHMVAALQMSVAKNPSYIEVKPF